MTERKPATAAVDRATRRLQSIDALRGAAALAVVVFHASKYHELHNAVWARSWPNAVFEWGRFGVWLFFVISGFCIHLRWAAAYQPGQPLPQLDFLAFWKRRFVRLYPPYAIALLLYVALMGIDGTPFTSTTLTRIGLHLVMLNNFDLKTIESINGVFWTLAIEEQLYLAYFLLLKLRVRFGWTTTLACCAAARLGWFALALILHRVAGLDLAVTQAAAAQWLVWALGAFAVEAALGIVTLPALWSSRGLGVVLIVGGIAITGAYLRMDSGLLRNALWLCADPIWGLGFFVWINYAVGAESRWRAAAMPRWVGGLAMLGLFSYSTYLTHEIVISHLWPLIHSPAADGMPLMIIGVAGLTLASLAAARVFFRWCEQPFINIARAVPVAMKPIPAV